MKNDFFGSMKEKMVPGDAMVDRLYQRLEGKRRESLGVGVLRSCAACLSVCVAALCVFNMAMPASAEKLPVVGAAFASLNETGREALRSGKTPEIFLSEEKEGEKSGLADMELSQGLCDGLDLTFSIRYEDDGAVIDGRVRSVTLSDAAVYYEGIALHPTNEAPILYKTAEGVYSGEARFNASVIAGLLENGEEMEFALHFSTALGYWDGMEKEGGAPFRYTGTFVTKGEAYVDLSRLSVEYVGLENDGMMLEYIIQGEERTDVLFKINGSVEYADCFIIGTESASPDCVTMNPGQGSDGSRTYCAVFTDGEKPEGSGESVKEDEREIRDTYIAPEDVVFYSTATGEYYYLIEEESGQ